MFKENLSTRQKDVWNWIETNKPKVAFTTNALSTFLNKIGAATFPSSLLMPILEIKKFNNLQKKKKRIGKKKDKKEETEDHLNHHENSKLIKYEWTPLPWHPSHEN